MNRGNIRIGMIVRSQDGQRLGKVVSRGAHTFHVERGLFSNVDFPIFYEKVAEIADDEVVLSCPADEVRQDDGMKGGILNTTAGRDDNYLGAEQASGSNPGFASEVQLPPDTGAQSSESQTRGKVKSEAQARRESLGKPEDLGNLPKTSTGEICGRGPLVTH